MLGNFSAGLAVGDAWDPSGLSQYGAMGGVAALFGLAAWVFYKRLSSAWDRERKQLIELINAAQARADRMQEDLSRTNMLYQTRGVGAVEEAMRMVSEAIRRNGGPGQ